VGGTKWEEKKSKKKKSALGKLRGILLKATGHRSRERRGRGTMGERREKWITGSLPDNFQKKKRERENFQGGGQQ